MKAYKRIGFFLLLGVMLVGLLTSGCALESTEPTDRGFALDRSLIGNCANAEVTKSVFDSTMHIMDGKTAESFFDTFLSGVQVTDNSERIEEVQSVGAPLGFPFQICFTSDMNANVVVCFYESGAFSVSSNEYKYATTQDGVVNLQEIESWLRERKVL